METSISANVTNCPAVCDNWLCWPSALPGHNVTQFCPKKKGILETATAYKYCDTNGRWETRNSTDGTQHYTHYEFCIIQQIQDIIEMCSSFGDDVCKQIGTITRCIEMAGLSFSLVSLLVSLYIFFSYRILKNNRTKIHKNLFIATLLQVVFRLIKYIDQGLEHKFLLDEYYISQAAVALLEYAKTAMFMWMFIEGLYLHNMITVTVFQEYTYIKVYFYIGWTVPALMIAIWLTVMLVKETNNTTWEYYYFLKYYWILEGPRTTVIMVNFLFLLNIIRVLIMKLRQTHTSEIERVRKAVRAAIFLLPLMGIAHMLFLLDYRFNDAWKFAFWSYTTYFLSTFQGFFVAVLYCFLNGEVQAVIKNSFYLHMSLRNYDYTPCRKFTLISTVPAESEGNHSADNFKWSQCCNQPPQSPEEKEIDICDLNERRNTTGVVTSISMVETNPSKRVQNETAWKENCDDETDTALMGNKCSTE